VFTDPARGNHDWRRNPQTGVAQPVPRHREINENLAKQILKKLKIPAE
jgi:DNA-directed RNA polymerase subunit H (RpoH/RPB5)